jgi:hypothetical protein
MNAACVAGFFLIATAVASPQVLFIAVSAWFS